MASTIDTQAALNNDPTAVSNMEIYCTGKAFQSQSQEKPLILDRLYKSGLHVGLGVYNECTVQIQLHVGTLVSGKVVGMGNPSLFSVSFSSCVRSTSRQYANC